MYTVLYIEDANSPTKRVHILNICTRTVSLIVRIFNLISPEFILFKLKRHDR